MRRRSLGIAAGLCAAALALAGLSAFSPSNGPAGVIADTASPSASPSPAPSASPGVSIVASPAIGQTGRTSTFAANVINALNPGALTYQWTFGDGASGNSQTTTHAYTTAGAYTVQVLVFGAGATPISAQISYTVLQSLGISANGPYTGQVGQPVAFRATAQPGVTLPADTLFSWDFGDGAKTTGPTPAHIYATTGVYTVTLTATSASTGQSGSTSTTATITAGPAPAQFSVSISGPTQVTAGASISYQATIGSGTAPSDVVYTWSFGDGSSMATGQNVNHIFAAAGSYTVTLTAVSAGTPSNSAGAAISVSVQTNFSTSSGNGTVTYQPGWNLVSGPAGTVFTGASDPLYSAQSGETQYESIPASTAAGAGRGYWALFNAPTTVTLAGSNVNTASVTASAGQWVMLGNPSATQTLTIHNADLAITYDPVAAGYVVISTLKPGQGAFVISLDGGTITVGP
jgi:PKD repeat protein